jgi:hypothetical protein
MELFRDMVIDHYERHKLGLPNRPQLRLERGFAIRGLRAPIEQQKKLIELTKNGGRIQGGVYGRSGTQFWNSLILRTINRDSLPKSVLHLDNNKLEFFYRYHSHIKWDWLDTEAACEVRELLKPIEKVFSKLTRVKIFLQIPGQRTPMHKDLAAGNYYRVKGPYSYVRGPDLVKHLGDAEINALDPAPDTSAHHRQNYLALKIPLTEVEGDYGRQVIIAEKPYFYSHGGQFYCFSEANWHGAETSPFYRGVVFVDGILKMDEVAALERDPIQLSPYDFQIEGRVKPLPEDGVFPLRGIEKQAFVPADAHLDVDKLKSLKQEIQLGLVLANRTISAPGPNGLPGDGIVDISEARIQIAQRPADDPVRIAVEQLRNINDIRLYLKIAVGAVSAGFGVDLRKPPGNKWDMKHDGQACAWTADAKHFPKTVDFVKSLPFTQIGRVHLFYQEAFVPVSCHFDGDSKDVNPHNHEFLWLQMDLDKKFYVFDSVTKTKYYVENYAVFFNEKDYHGADPIPNGAISLRVDGVFSPEFRAKLGLKSKTW